jgi:hypothetical protein
LVDLRRRRRSTVARATGRTCPSKGGDRAGRGQFKNTIVRSILDQMLDGEEDTVKLAHFCRGRLPEKIPEMQLALEGRMTEHHRWMLRLQREQLEFLEAQIAKLDTKILEAHERLSKGR